MHIHVPKMAHSLREFLVEISTITVGILIALSLEAGVEAWHHHELVEQARANIRRELEDNRNGLAKSLATERIALQGLNRMSDLVRTTLAGKKPESANFDINIVFIEMRTAAWESTVATQALTHMPYEEAQALALAYSASRTFNGLQQEARKPYIEMAGTLGEDPASMSKEELREAQRAVGINRMYVTAASATGQDLLEVYDRALERLD
jgi:hypothetical protein